ncbi:tRNA-specific adenosine deaminase [Candidatus Entotheonellaceae bacterium PAL068K]
MPQEHEGFMRLALEEAARGGAEGNMAVGSVIVHKGTVVARGRNLVTTTSDPTAHAEIVALRNAGAALQRTDFSGSTLYTTFEPCPMCCGAILASGLTTLVMGARPVLAERRWGAYTVESLIAQAQRSEQITVVTGILVQECADVRQVEGR